MFLRWMVRSDNQGVDFGIWNKISPADLICPVDLHVARVARGFGLISRKQTDWETAMELTSALRLMDNTDPVKYDFALFSWEYQRNISTSVRALFPYLLFPFSGRTLYRIRDPRMVVLTPNPL